MCKYMANKYVCFIFACLFSFVLCLNYDVKNHSLHFGISFISKDVKNQFCQSSKRIQGVTSEQSSNALSKYDVVSEDDIVRSQYKLLPYPLYTNVSFQYEEHFYNRTSFKSAEDYYQLNLESLNHYLYNGRNDFKSEFRCLIAGGGTSGGITYMGEQLNNTNAESVYVDFSKTSRKIAERRIKLRAKFNLQIVFVTAWIERLSLYGLGNFDLISSTGVLHHLKCPQKGLNVLNDLQSENGGAVISLYGTYARSEGHVEGSAPRLTDLPEETLDKWTYNGAIPKVIFHIDSESCPWKDEGPSKSWGMTDFQGWHGSVWKYGKKEYLWTEKFIDLLRAVYRRGKLLQPEQQRAANERSQFCGSLITYNKVTANSSDTWAKVPYFNDFIDEFYRTGFAFGLFSSLHPVEFEEHLKRHILEKVQDVKHVLVIGSKYPWIEAVLLEHGVEKITSLVTNPELTRSEHENITIVSQADLSNMWLDGKFEDENNRFDAVIAYNSLGQWHGLGGFGHPGYTVINPWADVLTLTKAWCVSKKQSRALVSLPMTKNFDDLVVFNSGKFFGRKQLANLFTNWKQVPEDYDYHDTMHFEKKQENIENDDMQSCSKDDVNCTSNERKDTADDTSYNNQPAATELGSYLPIYILEKQ